jgi:hypothetical protein
MAMRRVVVIAMPCTEVVDVAGILDISYAVNERTDRTGAFDAGYAVEVVSPVETVCTWPGLRLVADRSYRAVRRPIDTLIVTGIDEHRRCEARCGARALASAHGAADPADGGTLHPWRVWSVRRAISSSWSSSSRSKCVRATSATSVMRTARRVSSLANSSARAASMPRRSRPHRSSSKVRSMSACQWSPVKVSPPCFGGKWPGGRYPLPLRDRRLQATQLEATVIESCPWRVATRP